MAVQARSLYPVGRSENQPEGTCKLPKWESGDRWHNSQVGLVILTQKTCAKVTTLEWPSKGQDGIWLTSWFHGGYVAPCRGKSPFCLGGAELSRASS